MYNLLVVVDFFPCFLLLLRFCETYRLRKRVIQASFDKIGLDVVDTSTPVGVGLGVLCCYLLLRERQSLGTGRSRRELVWHVQRSESEEFLAGSSGMTDGRWRCRRRSLIPRGTQKNALYVRRQCPRWGERNSEREKEHLCGIGVETDWEGQLVWRESETERARESSRESQSKRNELPCNKKKKKFACVCRGVVHRGVSRNEAVERVEFPSKLEPNSDDDTVCSKSIVREGGGGLLRRS